MMKICQWIKIYKYYNLAIINNLPMYHSELKTECNI